MWEESELAMEGVVVDKLSEYLGKHLKREEIVEEGFTDIVYTRKVKEAKKRQRKVTKKVGKKYIHEKTKKKNKSDTDIPCNSNNVGYRWRCITCRERNIIKVYEGETGRSARVRGAEHLKELEKEKEKSVLFKHKLKEHKNENVTFQMEITKKFHDALSRKAQSGCNTRYLAGEVGDRIKDVFFLN